MDLSKILEIFNYYLQYFKNHFLCKRQHVYDRLDDLERLDDFDTEKYTFVMKR